MTQQPKTARRGTRLNWRLLRWTQYICLLIGIGALSWCAYVTADAKWTQASLERVLTGVRGGTRPTPPRAPAGDPLSQASSLVGRIDISRVGISAMVLEGDDPRTLARGVGHIPGTALPGWSGNVGFAGHRDTFFRALQNIRLGDDILVTTLQGCYRYRVVSSEIVSPDETRVLDASAVPSLTLVTCYPFYFIGSAPKRFVVHAHLVWDEMGVSSGTMGATVSNVASGSAAEEAGLRQRDVIQQGNRKPVVTANEFVTSVRAGRQPMLLLIDRGGDHLYLVVTPHA